MCYILVMLSTLRYMVYDVVILGITVYELYASLSTFGVFFHVFMLACNCSTATLWFDVIWLIPFNGNAHS